MYGVEVSWRSERIYQVNIEQTASRKSLNLGKRREEAEQTVQVGALGNLFSVDAQARRSGMEDKESNVRSLGEGGEEKS